MKVKSIDLPVVMTSIRQLDTSVLNDFVEYEVSRGFKMCLRPRGT